MVAVDGMRVTSKGLFIFLLSQLRLLYLSK